MQGSTPGRQGQPQTTTESGLTAMQLTATHRYQAAHLGDRVDRKSLQCHCQLRHDAAQQERIPL
eukprot:1157696-Pelagomonas_calceolata.AAC.2